ncbi:MAG: YihY/virulence factor BrkB family protein [Ignavibacteriae bacterium]|nr:YihY/virulence factor BrkB family protein [Ignavibacteriota bacterium]
MIDFVIRAVKAFLRVLEPIWFYVRGVWRKLLDGDILFLASGLAFNGILTMIPLLLLSASALGVFLNSSEMGVQQLHDVLNTIFPPQPFATSIKDSILSVVKDIIVYRTSLGLFGVLVLIWTATSLFDALRSALHNIYRLKRTRSLLVSFIHDLGFVALVFVLFVATNLTVWAISLLENLASTVPALASLNIPEYNETLSTIVVFILTGCMFYIIYRYIPDSKPPRAVGMISTITTTVLWVVSGRVFSLYLSHFSAIGKIYGPYAFILVLLFWIYYSSIVFLFGGMVGQIYWERRKLLESGKLERWV